MGIFGGQQMPALPPMPADPPPPKAQIDEATTQAVQDQRRRAAASAGYNSTIATGGQGVTTPAFTTANIGKTLLGS